jgi:hypothetical protein
VISDELYEHLTYDGRRHVSIASLPGMRERTITIFGFTKSARGRVSENQRFVVGARACLAPLERPL